MSKSVAVTIYCLACISFWTACAQAPKPVPAPAGAESCKTETDAATKAKTASDQCKKDCQTLKTAFNDAAAALKKCKDALPVTQGTTDAMSTQIDKLQTELDGLKDSDFELELGIGSLLRNGDTTDYSDNANTLSASNLGSATPQYLIGVAMRSAIPNFPFRGNKDTCKAVRDLARGDSTNVPKDKILAGLCPGWLQKPWAGFLSLKFSPGSTQTINGYVLGGSYRAMHYMNILVGFSLTPVNEPSYGLRTTASQYVTNQQKLGLLLNFNPLAMQNNVYNAFDGFSLTDPSGKLIYSGTPLEIHYRGGVVIGVSIPINFADFLKGK